MMITFGFLAGILSLGFIISAIILYFKSEKLHKETLESTESSMDTLNGWLDYKDGT